MSTSAEFVNMNRKRLLGQTDLDDRFLSYVRTLVEESYEASFRTGCVYDTALGLSADGNDKFRINGTSRATDGLGHMLDPDASGYAIGLQFENTNAIDYDVALHFGLIPAGLQANPRTGMPEFISWEEAIGESGEPNSVTDLGSTLRFVITNVTEASVSHAGRKALVWKNEPGRNALTFAQAAELCTVEFVGGVNRITTTSQFGQEAGSISTTPSDYTVVLLGPTVRRNTSLFGVDGYAYLGTVTGGGSGSPPSATDITQQDVIDVSLSDLADITRRASNDRLKIDVKAIAGESGEDQIRVTDSLGSVKFRVDEAGNVRIEGDLYVEGTTEQHDVVTVYSSETITDNLTAGDATTDSHLIKGTWRHTDPGATQNYFYVDGATGRVGINRQHEGAASEGFLGALSIASDTRIAGAVRIEATDPQLQFRDTNQGITSGGLYRWRADGGDFRLEENLAAGGDFSSVGMPLYYDRGNSALVTRNILPSADNLRDLGASGTEWRDLYVNRYAYIDELILGTASGEGLGTDMLPDSDAVRDLGSSSRRFAQTYTRQLYLDSTAGYGVGSDLAPTADNTYSIGTASRRWSNLYVTSLNFTGDFLPTTDNSQDIGSPSLRWAEGHYSTALHIGDGTSYSSPRSFLLDKTMSTLGASDIFAQISPVWNATNNSGEMTALNLYSSSQGDFYLHSGAIFAASAYGGVATPSGQTMRALQGYAMLASGSCSYVIGTEGYGRTGAGVTATNVMAFHAQNSCLGTVTNNYGLYVENLAGATNNYAIWTNDGIVRLGDEARTVDIRPLTHQTYSLGSSSYQWLDAYIWNGMFGSPSLLPASGRAIRAGNSMWTGGTDEYILSVDGYMGANITSTYKKVVGSFYMNCNAGAGWVDYEGDGLHVIAHKENAGTLSNWHGFDHRYIQTGGVVTSASAFYVRTPEISGGSTSTFAGLRIADITGASNNYAIVTGSGYVYFGDYLTMKTGKSIVPETDADTSMSIGVPSYRWGHGYFSDRVTIGGMSIDWGSFSRPIINMDTGDWIEYASDQYIFNIGSNSKLYIATSNSSFGTHVVPLLDKTYNLGSGTYRWAAINGQNLVLDARPSTGSNYLASYLTFLPTFSGAYQCVGYYGDMRANHTSGTLDAFYGGYFNVQGYGSGGTTTDMTALGLSVSEAAGHTITSMRGLMIDLGSQATTDKYGIYIGNVTGGATNNYAIYTSGGNVRFGGAFDAAGRCYDLLPTSASEHLGSATYRWGDIYGTTLDISSTFSLAAGDLAGDGSNVWTLCQTYLGAKTYTEPVGSAAGTNVWTTGGNGAWGWSVQNGSGRMNMGWNAYYDGTDWRCWKGGADGCSKVLVTDSSGTNSWVWAFAPAGASDGDTITFTDALGLSPTTLSCYVDLLPTHNTYDLGGSSNRWLMAYINNCNSQYFTPTQVNTCSGSFGPQTSGGYDLGSTSYPWRDIFTNSTGSYNYNAAKTHYIYIGPFNLGVTGTTAPWNYVTPYSIIHSSNDPAFWPIFGLRQGDTIKRVQWYAYHYAPDSGTSQLYFYISEKGWNSNTYTNRSGPHYGPSTSVAQYETLDSGTQTIAVNSGYVYWIRIYGTGTYTSSLCRCYGAEVQIERSELDNQEMKF